MLLFVVMIVYTDNICAEYDKIDDNVPRRWRYKDSGRFLSFWMQYEWAFEGNDYLHIYPMQLL